MTELIQERSLHVSKRCQWGTIGLLVVTVFGVALWHMYNNTILPSMRTEQSQVWRNEADYTALKHALADEIKPDVTKNTVLVCDTFVTDRIMAAWRGRVTNESEINRLKACQQYDEDATRERHPLTDILNNTGRVKAESVTFVTHLSSNRFEVLLNIFTHWDGPMSVSLYIRPQDIDDVSSSLCRLAAQRRERQVVSAQNSSGSVVSSRSNTSAASSAYGLVGLENMMLHIVPANGSYYPVNYMRSLALNHSTSRYVFLCDGDLVPMQGLHQRLLEHAQSQNMSQKMALVVPAFDWQAVSPEEQRRLFPANKTQLEDLQQQKTILPFKYEPHIPWTGQQPTNYNKWKEATSPYTVEYVERYEPYVVTERVSTPPYQERFVGRFEDRVSHLYELHMAGFKFQVVHDVFTIHSPHSRGDTNKLTVLYNRCASKHYNAFKAEMKQKYAKKPAN